MNVRCVWSRRPGLQEHDENHQTKVDRLRLGSTNADITLPGFWPMSPEGLISGHQRSSPTSPQFPRRQNRFHHLEPEVAAEIDQTKRDLLAVLATRIELRPPAEELSNRFTLSAIPEANATAYES